jgi:hypothetical protein
VNMVWKGYRSRLHKCNDFNAYRLFSRERGNHEGITQSVTQCFKPAVQLSTRVSDLLLSTGSLRTNLFPLSLTQ